MVYTLTLTSAFIKRFTFMRMIKAETVFRTHKHLQAHPTVKASIA